MGRLNRNSPVSRRLVGKYAFSRLHFTGGITVSGIKGKKIQYMATVDAIKQRHVDLDIVAIYEQLGICFGRKKPVINPEFEEISGAIDRYM